MKKLSPILLIGTLSMLFAEVFSGASRIWFLDGWSLLITFPLYLAHLLFFWWIALRFRKISLSQLYLFGAIFGLYEAYTTKVLWAGYMDAISPTIGTILGVGVVEFPILVFFWHPLMSFVIPILVFEILTKKAHLEHLSVLKKTKVKTKIIVLFLLLVATFAAKGHQFNIVTLNVGVIGTFLLILFFLKFSKNTNSAEGTNDKIGMGIFAFKKKIFLFIASYLILLYLALFRIITPEKTPNSIGPHLTIIFSYIFLSFIIWKSKKVDARATILDSNQYTKEDLYRFALIFFFATNVACFVPQISVAILGITYFSFAVLGIIIFLKVIWEKLKNIKKASKKGFLGE